MIYDGIRDRYWEPEGEPMDDFYHFCMASEKYRPVMEDDTSDLQLMNDAIRDFRAEYEAERLTGTLPGMEAQQPCPPTQPNS